MMENLLKACKLHVDDQQDAAVTESRIELETEAQLVSVDGEHGGEQGEKLAKPTMNKISHCNFFPVLLKSILPHYFFFIHISSSREYHVPLLMLFSSSYCEWLKKSFKLSVERRSDFSFQNIIFFSTIFFSLTFFFSLKNITKFPYSFFVC
jgi:hypothetical protein